MPPEGPPKTETFIQVHRDEMELAEDFGKREGDFNKEAAIKFFKFLSEKNLIVNPKENLEIVRKYPLIGEGWEKIFEFDKETLGHSIRVFNLMEVVMGQLGYYTGENGLNLKALKTRLRIATALHDIGKTSNQDFFCELDLFSQEEGKPNEYDLVYDDIRGNPDLRKVGMRIFDPKGEGHQAKRVIRLVSLRELVKTARVFLPQERNIMRQHVFEARIWFKKREDDDFGEENENLIVAAGDIVFKHHQFETSGVSERNYPQREIMDPDSLNSKCALILAMADTYDAKGTRRRYRGPCTRTDLKKIMYEKFYNHGAFSKVLPQEVIALIIETLDRRYVALQQQEELFNKVILKR
jgi:hypothetical protein